MSKCRSCEAPIVWAYTATGKRIPLDAAPVDDGNVELIGPEKAVVHGQPPMMGGPFYKSHFVTCPQADQWRKA